MVVAGRRLPIGASVPNIHRPNIQLREYSLNIHEFGPKQAFSVNIHEFFVNSL